MTNYIDWLGIDRLSFPVHNCNTAFATVRWSKIRPLQETWSILRLQQAGGSHNPTAPKADVTIGVTNFPTKNSNEVFWVPCTDAWLFRSTRTHKPQQ